MRIQSLRSHLLGVAGLTLIVTCSWGATPAEPEPKHLGVASCASSMCHGKLRAAADRNVALNEYLTWTHDDRHSRAFRTLQSPASQRLARALGLARADSAKICLDCHADNVAPESRGPRFQLTDGVGCEACHGGAEQWIESHTAKSTTHRDNLARGLQPLADPLARVERCLSCHLGSKDRLATHRIMAAGHPRLSFELESFAARQPPHFSIDADYERRKGKLGRAELWISGQIQGARSTLQLLRTPLFKRGSGLPEPAFYDCSSCHHTMQQYDWNAARSAAGLEPGTLQLQVANLLMLQALTAVLEPSKLQELSTLTSTLIQAGANNVAAVDSAAGNLLLWLDRNHKPLLRGLATAELERLRKALLDQGSNGQVLDFASAEQLFFGLESLSYALGDFATHRVQLDAVFKSIDTTGSFSPQRFAAALRRARASF